MTERIRKRLIKAARGKKTIFYADLNQDCDLVLDFTLAHHRNEIGELLGIISESEFANDRPLLSALVRHKSGQNEQGDGFFKLCEELGYGEWKNLKADPKFQFDIINECFAFWKDDANYRSFKDDFS